MPTPYETFEKTMNRVEGLLLLHPRLHGVRGRPAQHVADVLRGTLVLAVGALDALVLQSVAAAVPVALRAETLGPTVAKWIKESPEAFLKAMADDNPGMALAEICREKLGTMTFQRSAAIEGVLRDVLNCPPPWNTAAELLSERDENQWDPERVRDRLDEFVERRHRIAHSGDLLQERPSTRPITLAYVREAALVVGGVGDAIDRSATAALP